MTNVPGDPLSTSKAECDGFLVHSHVMLRTMDKVFSMCNGWSLAILVHHRSMSSHEAG